MKKCQKSRDTASLICFALNVKGPLLQSDPIIPEGTCQ